MSLLTSFLAYDAHNEYQGNGYEELCQFKNEKLIFEQHAIMEEVIKMSV